MTRTTLPWRRANQTREVEWDGHPIIVTVGFDEQGCPRETFANTPRGGAMAVTLADACILISIGLQHGLTPHDLGKSLGRITEWATVDGERRKVDAPASPIGTILGVVLAESADRLGGGE